MPDYKPPKLDDKGLKKLKQSIRSSRDGISKFCAKRVDILKQYVGGNYGEDGADDRVPVNMVELFYTVYMTALAADPPKVLVTTNKDNLKSQASRSTAETNQALSRMRLEETIQDWVFDALTYLGVLKVGLRSSGTVDIDDVRYATGTPYAARVDLDDFVYDFDAKCISDSTYMGNVYRLPYHVVKDSEFYKQKGRDLLKPVRTLDEPEDDWASGEDRADELSGTKSSEDGFYEYVDLIDLWLPLENKILTMPWGGVEWKLDAALYLEDWQGPANGPYHVLSYGRVPNNVMGAGPAIQLIDLHLLINDLFRKSGRQAIDEKTILGVMGGADEDGNRIIKAGDGQAIRLDNPDKTREYHYGGVNAKTMAFMMQSWEVFNKLAGNLDVIGGLGAQADTLGQEQILAASSSRRLQRMQKITMSATQRVVRDIAWYQWHDPLKQEVVSRPIPGTGLSVTTTLTPEDQRGDFLDFNFEIEPYSMSGRTPTERLAIVDRFMQGVMSAMPMIQQQGGNVDWRSYQDIYARYSGVDEIREVLVFGGAPSQMEAQDQMSGQPAQTQRTYIRRNEGGGQRMSASQQLMQHLLNNDTNGDGQGAVSAMGGY